jgi:peptidoglycan L-alanyl-D-glutamate endopeptidase CwlK
MGFNLSNRSLLNLENVHPLLVNAVKIAIAISDQDFCILNGGGLRTKAQQNALYKRGVSKLDGYKRKSYHQRQSDGYGWAVDLVPFISGAPRWEWNAIYPIACAMKIAAGEENLNIPVRWGGNWNMIGPTSVFDMSTPQALEAEIQAYVDRRRKRGKSAFTDGPHYEYRPDKL